MPNAEEYAWYKSHGICPKCQKRKAANGKTKCLQCQGEHIEWYVNWYQNLPPEKLKAKKARESAYHKQQRDERKAKGLCVDCGKYPAIQNRTRCRLCSAKQNAYQAEYRMKKAIQQGKDCTPRFKRTQLGKCYICGEPLSPESKTFCPKCLEIQRKKAAHMRTFIKPENRHFPESYQKWAAAFWAKKKYYIAKHKQKEGDAG